MAMAPSGRLGFSAGVFEVLWPLAIDHCDVANSAFDALHPPLAPESAIHACK
jgi:hypothetical protein